MLASFWTHCRRRRRRHGGLGPRTLCINANSNQPSGVKRPVGALPADGFAVVLATLVGCADGANRMGCGRAGILGLGRNLRSGKVGGLGYYTGIALGT
jgi:hypothetical protein